MADGKIKQYCRYCSFCFAADDYRCSAHPKGLEPHWTREQINRLNHCPNFDLSPLGDVDTGRQYTPRPRIKDDRQIKFNLEVDDGKRTDR